MRRFIKEHPAGRYYVRKRGHAFAINDGVVSDKTSLNAILLDAWQFQAVQS